MSVPIRVGFVGLSLSGWASMALGPALFSLKDKYRLVAVSTSSEASAAAAAVKYSEIVGHPVKAYYGSTDKIANDPEVDLVVVSVRTPHHRELLLPAIAAKKAVFIEWGPACVNLTQIVDVAEKAAQNGVRSMVGFQSYQSPVVRKVKELVESGKIGKVLSMTYVAMAPREQHFWPPSVMARRDYNYTIDPANGATLLNVALGQPMAAVTFAVGDFASVTAVQQQHYPVVTIVDEAGKPTGETSGAVASVILRGGQTSIPGRRQFLWEIDGEEGVIRVEGDKLGAAWINVSGPSISLNGEPMELPASGLLGNLTSAWEEFAKGSNGSYATLV